MTSYAPLGPGDPSPDGDAPTRSVALATCSAPDPPDTDLPLIEAALADLGIGCDIAVWDDPSVDWAAYDLVVVRSTWDYAFRRETFLAWARSVPHLANPASVLAWNTDKVYLRELRAAGLPVISTWWDPAPGADLGAGGEWVVKPSVSASSRDTARWSERTDVDAHVAQLRRAGRTAMVQPYVTSVDSDGETALLYAGTRFSHAVRRGAVLVRGEGVRQDRDGRETVVAAQPRTDQLELAASVLARVRDRFGADAVLYARVDVVDDPDGRPLLLELELTEPGLFLTPGNGGAPRLARAIAQRLGVQVARG